MLERNEAFSGFSTDDISQAKAFYADTLGLKVEEQNDLLGLQLAGGGEVLIYPKENHEPATFTVLNFRVADIEQIVDQLVERGITMERYDGFNLDERGIFRDEGPLIAWFKDPAGNVLSVLQEQ